MSDKFKQLFEEARANGVDPDWVDRFETSFEASGLRKDLNTTKEENRALRETAKSLRTGLLKDRFTKFGITVSPDILNIPEDLNPTDEDTVKDWAVNMGLLANTPSTPEPERATHDKIAAASNEGGQPSISLADLDPTKLSEDEFYEKALAIQAQIKKTL